MLIQRSKAKVSTLTLASGNTVNTSTDPNAPEGFGIADIVTRGIEVTLNPEETLLATRAVMTDLRTGTARIIAARLGSTAGSRIALTVPAGRYVAKEAGERDGKAVESVTVEASDPDAGAFICVF